MAWNPDQYLKFEDERFLPFEDLFSLIEVRKGLSVVDLGCGTGELTARLAGRLPQSSVLGVDSSASMLARAAEHERSGLAFEKRQIEEVTGCWDLVFSHAALHWVENHHELVPRLLALVRPGGQLAVQMPANHRHPSQTLIAETAAEEPFRAALGGWSRHSPVLEADAYAELLYRNGCGKMTVLDKVYPHLLEDSDAVAAWTAGTTLVPYFERLPRELHEPFMDRYRLKLRAVWPQGPVFFTFRRILIAASVAG